MNYIEQQKRPWRNVPGLIIVVGMHVVLIYALVFVLGRNVIDKIKAPIETKIIKEENKPPPPPPPPPPDLPPPPPQAYVPPPEVQIAPPPQQTNAIAAVQTTVKPTFTPPRPTPPPSAVPDTSFSAAHVISGPRQPEYPDQYADSGRTGRVTVDCVIETDGSPTNCKVLNTAGGAAFAQSTMNWLEHQGVRYKPAIKNGQAQREEHQWVVTFQSSD